MNYSELSLEERMRHAEEYVLILNDEIKLPAQVISELSKTFFLSAEEAGTAYKNAQQKYRPAFAASTRRKRVYALVLFLVSSTIGLFYVFMSKEPALAGLIRLATFSWLLLLPGYTILSNYFRVRKPAKNPYSTFYYISFSFFIFAALWQTKQTILRRLSLIVRNMAIFFNHLKYMMALLQYMITDKMAPSLKRI